MHTQEQLLSTLRIEDTGVPIYVQLREQFLRMMGAGRLKPGDQMPTMRQVAVSLRVDLNTVRHAYDDLERAGAVILVRGRGSFVAEPAATLTGPDHEAETERLARQALAAAAAAGVDPAALARKINELATQEDAP
ncbi:MAG: GntR family transcriptional regulator [Phenylobacterium sp.]|nr:MAG: GntR family transcriptional regulator [Phenylobacterium sp.]